MDIRSEAGNTALLIAVGLAGLGGIVLKNNLDQQALDLREFRQEKTIEAAGMAGHSSFNAAGGLFSFINGKPALFPDPYTGDYMKLRDFSGLRSKPWSIKNGILTMKLPSGTSYGNKDYNKIFQGDDPGVIKTLTMKLLRANVSRQYPYYVESVDVETRITTNVKKDGMGRTIKKRARLGLPPPPDPTCSIKPADDKVDEDKVSVAIRSSGVSLGAFIEFGGEAIRVGGVPTAGNSINTVGKKLGSKTITGLKVGDNEIKGYVLNVMNKKIACASAVVERENADIFSCNYKCPNSKDDPHRFQSAQGNPAIFTAPPFPARHTSLPYSQHLWEWMYLDPLYPSRLACLDRDSRRSDGNYGKIYAFDPAKNCERTTNPIGNRKRNGCFAAGTMITLDKSGHTLPISAIEPGMMVWNPGLKKPMEVARVIRGPEALPMLRLGYGSRTLEVTHNHPFVGRGGVMAAKHLRVGDEILDHRGEFRQITSFAWISPASDEVVWNIELKTDSDDYQDHLVEANGMVSGDLFLQERLDRSQGQMVSRR